MTPEMPAFFGRATAVLGQHAVLHETVRALRTWCASSRSRESRSDLVELMNAFVGQLEAHFAAEESDGYFGTLLTTFPAASASIDRLRTEHASFLLVARALRIQAPEPASQLEVYTSLRNLLDALDRHERAESLLLQHYFRNAQV